MLNSRYDFCMLAIARREGDVKCVPNDLHRGMWNRCGQLHAFMCRRWSGGALVSPTWSFECEKRLCTPKHGEGHEPR